MKLYLRILSVFYFIGFVLHVLDVLELRLNFSTMSNGWKVWIVYLLIADFLTSVGLWLQQPWGVGLFLFVAISQLVAYTSYPSFFGDQWPLIVFHIVTLAIFVFLMLQQVRKQKSQKP